MEFKDPGAEVETIGGGSLLKNRFVQIIIALLALGFLGFLILVLFLFQALAGGRGLTVAGAQRTATTASIFQMTKTAPSFSQSATAVPSISQPATTVPSTSRATPSHTSTAVAPSTPGPTTAPALATLTPTQAAIPTTTPASSPSTASRGTPSTNLRSGIYVSSLRADPAKATRGEPINFFVTIVNTTAQPQVHKLCVEIYRPGEAKSFGVTSCPQQTVPLGTHEVSAGSWILGGIHECMTVRARAITRDEGAPLTALQQPGGSVLWLNLQVCP